MCDQLHADAAHAALNTQRQSPEVHSEPGAGLAKHGMEHGGGELPHVCVLLEQAVALGQLREACMQPWMGGAQPMQRAIVGPSLAMPVLTSHAACERHAMPVLMSTKGTEDSP
jgi:hypothetical protein